MYVRKNLPAILVTAWLVAIVWSAPSGAYDISGALTADNNFILYYGAANGGNLTYVTSGDDLRLAYPFSISNPPPGSHLYVLAWNGIPVPPPFPGFLNPQAWLGQFNLPGGTTLYSDLTQWQYTYTASGNPSLGSPVPDLGTVAGLIANAQWLTATPNPGTDFSNNTCPYDDPNNFWNQLGYTPPGFDSNANWIWFDKFDITSASEYGYAIFRTNEPVEPVPLPSTLLLLATGLLALLARKHRKIQVLSARFKGATAPAT